MIYYKRGHTVLDDVVTKHNKIIESQDYCDFREIIGDDSQKECWFEYLEQLRSLDGGIILNIFINNRIICTPIRTIEEYEAAEELEHFFDVSSTEIFLAIGRINFVFEIIDGHHRGTRFQSHIQGAVNDILGYFVH